MRTTGQRNESWRVGLGEGGRRGRTEREDGEGGRRGRMDGEGGRRGRTE